MGKIKMKLVNILSYFALVIGGTLVGLFLPPINTLEFWGGILGLAIAVSGATALGMEY